MELRAFFRLQERERREELESMGRVLRGHAVVIGGDGADDVGSSADLGRERRRVDDGSTRMLDEAEQLRREERRRLRMASDGHNEDRCECELCVPDKMMPGLRRVKGEWKEE